MNIRPAIDDGHECRGCWTLQEMSFADNLEEIVAHEDPQGGFITITDTRGAVERYPIDAPMIGSYLGARGIDWP